MVFKPGQSGNPGGKRKDVLGIKALALACAPDCIRTLKEIMKDEKSPKVARIAAAAALLDRGLGKPEQHQTIEGGLNVHYAISDKPASPEEWNTQYADPVADESQVKH